MGYLNSACFPFQNLLLYYLYNLIGNQNQNQQRNEPFRDIPVLEKGDSCKRLCYTCLVINVFIEFYFSALLTVM